MGLKTNVLRGKEHVGENLIEITDGKTKILIECGVSLNPSKRSQEIERAVLSTHYDAIIISHSHLDHAGLLKSEVKADAIYMGESTYKLLTITESICENNRQWVRFFESERHFCTASFVPRTIVSPGSLFPPCSWRSQFLASMFRAYRLHKLPPSSDYTSGHHHLLASLENLGKVVKSTVSMCVFSF